MLIHSEIFLGSITRSVTVLPDRLLGGVFVGEECLDLLAVVVLGHVVGLPFLEAEAESFIRRSMLLE